MLVEAVSQYECLKEVRHQKRGVHNHIHLKNTLSALPVKDL